MNKTVQSKLCKSFKQEEFRVGCWVPLNMFDVSRECPSEVIRAWDTQRFKKARPAWLSG